MKILFLIQSLNVGGAERQLILLSNGLAARGHDVSVASFYPGKLDGELGRSVKLIPLEKRSRWDNFATFVRLLKVVRETGPDVVYSFLVVPNLISAMLKIIFPRVRVIWGIRSSNILHAHYSFIDKTAFRITALFSTIPNLIISNSETARDYHRRYYRRSDIIKVIPNGVDMKRYRYSEKSRADLRREWKIADDELLVGIVGRLNPVKDHPLFLRTIEQMTREGRGVRAICVGSGPQPYREELLELARELGVVGHVRWIDHMVDMAAVYSAFDVTVLCSKSESFPNVVIESLACGTPCVVTKSAGDSASIVGEYGVVCDSDPVKLASACWSLARKRELRAEISARVSASYDQEKLFAQTEELFIAENDDTSEQYGDNRGGDHDRV